MPKVRRTRKPDRERRMSAYGKRLCCQDYLEVESGAFVTHAQSR
jgi:hypothetical protein